MEKIKVNQSIRQNYIDTTTKTCLECIKDNASLGVDTTDLYINKEIASDVKDQIIHQLDESKTPYEFLIVARGSNQITGRPESYTSETVGIEKHYRIKLYFVTK